MDAKYERDASSVHKTANFNLPIKKQRNGDFKLVDNDFIYTCFTSDFFLDEADEWRIEAWKMIKTRSDLHFFIITKRIDRFLINLPDDWGEGYENVTIGCTCENQDRASYRLPMFIDMPIKHKIIICEPLIENINISIWLSKSIEAVIIGGESGNEARICNFDWVMNIRNQCIEKKVPMHFKQTGAKFIKDGQLYLIKRHFQHSQARKAKIDYNFNYR
jgi:protein gp37